MVNKHVVEFGTSTIHFELSYASRKTLGITVHPDQRVIVKAPEGTDMAKVREIVHRRAAWILRQQRFFERLPDPPQPREYVSGETHLYLSRQYRLKVIEDEQESVKMMRGRIYLYVHDKADMVRKERLLKDWYREQGKRVFAERLDVCYPMVQRLDIPYPDIYIREMETRWGSCSGQAERINLNLRLMQVPKYCIDYVIVHELCHFREHNHSRKYFALLDQVMPDWEVRREKLNQFQIS